MGEIEEDYHKIFLDIMYCKLLIDVFLFVTASSKGGINTLFPLFSLFVLDPPLDIFAWGTF